MSEIHVDCNAFPFIQSAMELTMTYSRFPMCLHLYHKANFSDNYILSCVHSLIRTACSVILATSFYDIYQRNKKKKKKKKIFL